MVSVPVPGRQHRLAPRRIGAVSQRALIAASLLIALALLAPLLLIALQAHAGGWAEVHRVLFRAETATLLEHTVALSVIVVVAASVVGVAAAWATERSGLPFARVWTALLVIPVAIPDFVVSYAWHSIARQGPPLAMASLVMTLGTYPLVYLPVAAALRRCDPAMEETAWSLGVGRLRTFVTVTLPLLRTALLGGAVLVVLTVLSEYGAFEILRYDTFTTAVFTEFDASGPAAAGALCVPLVGLGILVLCLDALVPGRAVPTARVSRSSVAAVRSRLLLPVTLGLVVLVGLGVGVPIGTIVYWMRASQHATLPATATLAGATWATVRYSASGALISVLLAIPVAMMTFRRRTAPRLALERSTYLTQAVPGVAVALALTFFGVHYFLPVYETGVMLVVAYAILHFPLALACVKSSVSQAPPALSDVGQSLGRGPVAVFFRVTLPLIAPGLGAGFCLVFLTAVTELTATLLLAPIGVTTLATQFWAFQSGIEYGAAAPYALVIVILAAVPGALVGLWFDRGRRAAAPAPARATPA